MVEKGGEVMSDKEDRLDALRYRYLRSFAERDGRNVKLFFWWSQNDNWPAQNAFEDLDMAIDEAIKYKGE